MNQLARQYRQHYKINRHNSLTTVLEENFINIELYDLTMFPTIRVLERLSKDIQVLTFNSCYLDNAEELKLLRFTQLKQLSFILCPNLKFLPTIPSSVTYLQLRPSSMTHMKNLNENIDFKALPRGLKKISRSNIGHDDDFEFLPSTITHLDMSPQYGLDLQHSINTVRHLQKLKTLRYLDISNCTNISPQIFSDEILMESVQILKFNFAELSIESASISVKQAFPNLIELSLAYADIPEDLLRTLPESLQVLELSSLDRSILIHIPSNVKYLRFRRHPSDFSTIDGIENYSDRKIQELCWTFGVDMRFNQNREQLIREITEKHAMIK